jgi:hypothetical protein
MRSRAHLEQFIALVERMLEGESKYPAPALALPDVAPNSAFKSSRYTGKLNIYNH